MTKKMIIISSLISLVLIGVGIKHALNKGLVEKYCETREPVDECMCATNFILDNVTSQHRKEIYQTMKQGYIPQYPDIMVAAIKAYFVCAK